MPFEWMVALRYLREGRTQTLLILAGVTVGVAVTVFLSALIGGLQTSLIQQTLGSQAHIVITPPEEKPRILPAAGGEALASTVEKAPQRTRAIPDWQRVLETVQRTPGVVAATPLASGTGLATRGRAVKSIALLGVDPAGFDRVVPLARRVVAGRYLVRGTQAVLGRELADLLGAGVGDRVRIVATEGRSETFTVAGIVDLGTREVNQRWVIVALRPAQSLLDLGSGASTIDAAVADVFSADRIAAGIGAQTGLAADSWMKINQQLLVGLRAQASSRTIIQTFVIIAVTLAIASVLAVSVVQKSREIGILKAVGTATARVVRVFLLEGALVGLAGSIAGSALGAALSLLFASVVKNPDGTPRFPAELPPSLFVGASAIAIAAGLAGAVFPARRAARLDPAEVIRYG